MNRRKFIEDSSVKAFVKWLGLKLDKPQSFIHSYTLQKQKKKWNCDSIYSAYENYLWQFKCHDPITNKILQGKTFEESEQTLSLLSSRLRKSVREDDAECTRLHCISILEWGGVLPKNQDKILEKGDDLPKYLEGVKRRLNPSEFDTEEKYDDIIMNSGFTKIYSLLIDDFVIYDGRVGAALGLLVRRYCEEYNLPDIPDLLDFAYGNARGSTRRNPSTDRYRFSILSNSWAKHTENNLRGNWLLKEIIETCNSKFNLLHPSKQLRALESALFMIGYDVMVSQSRDHVNYQRILNTW